MPKLRRLLRWRSRVWSRVWISGNKIGLLKNGHEIYPEMLRAIAEAKESICLETYLFRSDRIGWQFAQALAQKAKEGLSVRLIYDSLGSFTTAPELFQHLEESGVSIFEYHPVTPWRRGWRFRSKLKRRDHRKILIIDNRYAFVGGANIGDEYIAPVEEEGEGWRDTHLKIEGPAVTRLQKIFFVTWLKGEVREKRLIHFGSEGLPRVGDLTISVVAANGIRGRNQIKKAYLRAVRRARHRICMTNSYFVPPHWFLRALKKAVQRGVEVSILLPKHSDVRIVDYASRALYANLLKSGVRIFEWEGSVLHAKTAVIDGRWSTIGSSNMDRFSFFYNLEVNVVVIGSPFGKEMEAMFEADLKQAREILAPEWTRRNWFQRLLENIFYYLLEWV
ncbi:MAG: cardiolipin synthase [Candidatus Manganitrophaceae bacterium]